MNRSVLIGERIRFGETKEVFVERPRFFQVMHIERHVREANDRRACRNIGSAQGPERNEREQQRENAAVFHFGAEVWFFVKAATGVSEQLRKQRLGFSMRFLRWQKVCLPVAGIAYCVRETWIQFYSHYERKNRFCRRWAHGLEHGAAIEGMRLYDFGDLRYSNAGGIGSLTGIGMRRG